MTAIPKTRVPLGSWPTPLEPAGRLAAAIGLREGDLWLKRDDLTGLAGGGNKIRKLEWTLAAALDGGADTVVTTGAPQSNHARLTAAAAARVGVHAVLVFPGPAPDTAAGNLILDGLLGATVVWADGDGGLDAAADEVAAGLRRQGRRPAIIPFGGSSAVGAHGYRLAAAELQAQVPQLDVTVCAVGSGGTMAGLVAGLGAERVLGVHTGAVDDPRPRVARLLADMAQPVPADDLRIRTDHVGDGYETLTPAAGRALLTAARSEGVVLDPVYTARALAGLISAVEEGSIRPGQTVVFLASGGLPALLGHHSVAALAGAELTP